MYEHLMRWQWELDNIFLLDAVCIVGVVCIVECLACVERAASGTKAPMTDLWPTGMCSRKESHDESMEKGYKKLSHEIFGQMWLRYTATIRWTNPIWLSEGCKTNLSSSLSLSLSLSRSHAKEIMAVAQRWSPYYGLLRYHWVASFFSALKSSCKAVVFLRQRWTILLTKVIGCINLGCQSKTFQGSMLTSSTRPSKIFTKAIICASQGHSQHEWSWSESTVLVMLVPNQTWWHEVENVLSWYI